MKKKQQHLLRLLEEVETDQEEAVDEKTASSAVVCRQG